MNERLFGLSQALRLPLSDAETKRLRRADIYAEAERQGFARVERSLDEERPGQTEVMRQLFEVDGNVSLGEFVYGSFSAVAHGTTFGLADSVTRDAPNMPKTPGVQWGAVYTSSGKVVTVLTATMMGVGQAQRRRNELFGWRSEEWSGAFLGALDAAKASLPKEEGSG